MLKKLLIIFLILILTVPTISIGVSGDLNDYEPKLNQEDVSGYSYHIKLGGVILKVITIIGVIGAVIIGCIILVSSTVIVRSIYKGLNARKITNHKPPPIALPIPIED